MVGVACAHPRASASDGQEACMQSRCESAGVVVQPETGPRNQHYRASRNEALAKILFELQA
jgi:hypothetical protein